MNSLVASWTSSFASRETLEDSGKAPFIHRLILAIGKYLETSSPSGVVSSRSLHPETTQTRPMQHVLIQVAARQLEKPNLPLLFVSVGACSGIVIRTFRGCSWPRCAHSSFDPKAGQENPTARARSNLETPDSCEGLTGFRLRGVRRWRHTRRSESVRLKSALLCSAVRCGTRGGATVYASPAGRSLRCLSCRSRNVGIKWNGFISWTRMYTINWSFFPLLSTPAFEGLLCESCISYVLFLGLRSTVSPFPRDRL